ncbi:unnamed protein product [Discosporangium mesarthrocarpum]
MNKRFTDLEYTLFDADGNEYTHRGAYLIVDGGYHRWKCLMAPYKASRNEDQLQWSKRFESVQKDVECFFGTLKGCVRILKLPLGFRAEDRISNMFYTCCVLHNVLCAYDGLNWYGQGVN